MIKIEKAIPKLRLDKANVKQLKYCLRCELNEMAQGGPGRGRVRQGNDFGAGYTYACSYMA